jgi:hypothetical protein
MLYIEPAGRCTLTDLLKGKGKTSSLLCGCRRGPEGQADREAARERERARLDSISSAAGMQRSVSMGHVESPSRTRAASPSPPTTFTAGFCVDHDAHEVEDEDEGDEWLKSIVPCSASGIVPKHVHIKVAVDEKAAKKKWL